MALRTDGRRSVLAARARRPRSNRPPQRGRRVARANRRARHRGQRRIGEPAAGRSARTLRSTERPRPAAGRRRTDDHRHRVRAPARGTVQDPGLERRPCRERPGRAAGRRRGPLRRAGDARSSARQRAADPARRAADCDRRRRDRAGAGGRSRRGVGHLPVRYEVRARDAHVSGRRRVVAWRRSVRRAVVERRRRRRADLARGPAERPVDVPPAGPGPRRRAAHRRGPAADGPPRAPAPTDTCGRGVSALVARRGGTADRGRREPLVAGAAGRRPAGLSPGDRRRRRTRGRGAPAGIAVVARPSSAAAGARALALRPRADRRRRRVRRVLRRNRDAPAHAHPADDAGRVAAAAVPSTRRGARLSGRPAARGVGPVLDGRAPARADGRSMAAACAPVADVAGRRPVVARAGAGRARLAPGTAPRARLAMDAGRRRGRGLRHRRGRASPPLSPDIAGHAARAALRLAARSGAGALPGRLVL